MPNLTMSPSPSQTPPTDLESGSQSQRPEYDSVIIGVEDMDIEPEIPLLESEKTITSISSSGSFRGSELSSEGSDDLSTTKLLENENNENEKNKMSQPSILASITLHPLPPHDEKHVQINLPSPPESNTASQIFRSGQVWPQVMAAIAVSLGSMIIGFGSAYTATALPTMTAEQNSTLIIDSEGHEASWIGSLLPLGALVGGIGGGTMVEVLGRKSTILATSGPFILSWLLIALATDVYMIYIARAIAGFCVGVASLSLPVYLAETVQPEVRGTLGLLPTTIGNMGILICFTSGSLMNWSQLAYLGAVLSLPFLVAMMYIPETPRWYIAKGKEEEAQKALQWLRGPSADIRTELNEIKNTHLLSTKYATKMKDLLGKTYLKPLLTSLGLMFFQQFSGINAVIFYTVYIFGLSGSTVDSNLSTIVVGIVNIAATIGATLLIDRLGRKVLLVISGVFMCICLLCLGVFFYLRKFYPESIDGLGLVPLVAFMLFVVAFSLGYGPIPWLMMGEIFPGRIRGSAAAIATAFNWSCTFTVTKTFPQFVTAFGGHSAFFSFALVCFVGIFFVIFCVPETRGKSLEDIERNLTRPFRRISSTANLKPLPMII